MQTATNRLETKAFVAKHDTPPFGDPVFYKALVAQLIRTGTTLRAVMDFHDITTDDTPDIVSAKYPDLDESSITVSDAGYLPDGRAYFDWDPSTMPTEIEDGDTVDAGDTVAQMEHVSAIIFSASNVQIEGTSGEGAQIELFGRLHQFGSWLSLGSWEEGVDDFPIIVEFDKPLPQLKVVGNDVEFQVYAQR